MMNNFHLHIIWDLVFGIWNLEFGAWNLAFAPCT